MPSKSEYKSDVAALGVVLDALSKLGSAAQQWVLSTAASRLQLALAPAPPPGPAAIGATAAAASSGGNLTSPKDFVRVKGPQSDVDRVACLAYFLTHHRQTAAYSSRELTAINTEAAGPKLNMSRAVDNATKQSRYLTSAGKGKKQITTLGEDVVGALPEYERVKAAIAASKATTRKKRAKKSRAK